MWEKKEENVEGVQFPRNRRTLFPEAPFFQKSLPRPLGEKMGPAQRCVRTVYGGKGTLIAKNKSETLAGSLAGEVEYEEVWAEKKKCALWISVSFFRLFIYIRGIWENVRISGFLFRSLVTTVLCRSVSV